ncbi:hypothetical protein RYX36_019467 [Vicia faba]
MAGYSLVCYFLQISNEENERNYENLSVAERSKVIETRGSSTALDGSSFPSEISFANEMPTVQEHGFSSGKPAAASTPFDHPVGLRSAAPLSKPAPRAMQQPTENRISEKEKKL